MDKFLSLLGQYAQIWASLGGHVLKGEGVEALACAQKALSLAQEIDTEIGRLEDAGISIPSALDPYDTYYGETLSEVKCPDGMMIHHKWMPWPFDLEM